MDITCGLVPGYITRTAVVIWLLHSLPCLFIYSSVVTKIFFSPSFYMRIAGGD